MNFPAYLRSLAAKFFHRSEVAEDMEEELRSHIQHRADDLERSGLDRAEAERQARIEFGGPERYKEECHQAMGGISSRRWCRMCGSLSACCASPPVSPSPLL